MPKYAKSIVDFILERSKKYASKDSAKKFEELFSNKVSVLYVLNIVNSDRIFNQRTNAAFSDSCCATIVYKFTVAFFYSCLTLILGMISIR